MSIMYIVCMHVYYMYTLCILFTNNGLFIHIIEMKIPLLHENKSAGYVKGQCLKTAYYNSGNHYSFAFCYFTKQYMWKFYNGS